MQHVFRLFGQRKGSHLWDLDPEDFQQMVKVLRVEVGSFFEITDGFGWSCSARVTGRSKKEIQFEIVSETNEPSPSHRLAVAIGAIKPKDFFECLPRLVEIGVDDVHIFNQLGISRQRTDPKIIQRANRVLKESCKVSKRSYLPPLKVHDSLEELLRFSDSFGGSRFAGVPDAKPLFKFTVDSREALLVIGGERGLDGRELSLLSSHQFKQVSLGPHIMRASTAIMCGAAVLSSRGDYGFGVRATEGD